MPRKSRSSPGLRRTACEILRRPFFPGADGEWVDTRRQILQRANLRALGVLAELHSWNSEAALAVRVAEVIIAVEPFRESGYGLLMRIHQRNGDRAEALRVYERCRRLLADELGERPGAAIEAVRAEIGGEATAAKRPRPNHQPPMKAAAPEHRGELLSRPRKPGRGRWPISSSCASSAGTPGSANCGQRCGANTQPQPLRRDLNKRYATLRSQRSSEIGPYEADPTSTTPKANSAAIATGHTMSTAYH